MEIAPGQTLGRYTLEERIGRGRLGEVWRALDTSIERHVAIKVVLRAAMSDLGDARAALRLAHENCVPLYDVGESEDAFCFVMAEARGKPLRAYLTDQAVPTALRLKWLAGVARGLAAAHDAGIVHRNVSPANVFVTMDGGAKLVDFGVGKPAPEYLAPEQAEGAGDARSDQYSLGITAYELLTNKHPDAKKVARRRLRVYAPEISGEIADAVHKMMSPNPSDRFASIAEATTALLVGAGLPPISPSKGVPGAPISEPAGPPTPRSIPPRASLPPRMSVPPPNADPRARALAASFAAAFEGDARSESGYFMDLRVSEKTTHPLVLVARDASFGALVAGSVNFDTSSAELRAFDFLALLHTERRTGKPFLDRASFESIVKTVQSLLRDAGVTTFATVAAPPDLRESMMRPRSIPPPRT